MTEYVKQENMVVAYEQAPSGAECFRTYGEFARLGRDWSGKALVDLYNNLASAQGKDPVRKFMHREAGMKRCWKLLQDLPVQQPTPTGARVSKKETVLRMVQQPS